MTRGIRVDGDHLALSLAQANQFGSLPNGGVQRLAWSEPEVAARAWLLDHCLAEGLEADQDPAGNVWAWGGQQPAIVMGSHLDTVPNGGAFDGALGVVAALEILKTARRERVPHADRLAMVCFTDEEGVRFSTGMTGSRAVAGTLDEAELASAFTADGHRLSDVLRDRGLDPARVPDAVERRSMIAVYLELHIEQGRRLERQDASVGLVNAIAGLNIWHIHVQGEANHAGTTQLSDRRDALMPAAAAILGARETMGDLPGLAATVGDVRADSAASNIVAGASHFSLDLRSTDPEQLEEATRRILDVIRSTAADNGCHVEAELSKSMPPVQLDSSILSATKATSPTNKVRPELSSMAGHDAMSLAAAGVPAGMIFVRSHRGLSHCPQEHSSDSDCVEGTQQMADTALRLAGDLS